MAKPITGQDDWQRENIDYLAKDGVIAEQVLPKLHAGDYEVTKKHGQKYAVVTVELVLSIHD